VDQLQNYSGLNKKIQPHSTHKISFQTNEFQQQKYSIISAILTQADNINSKNGTDYDDDV
jgi:hypothetical protein